MQAKPVNSKEHVTHTNLYELMDVCGQRDAIFRQPWFEVDRGKLVAAATSLCSGQKRV